MVTLKRGSKGSEVLKLQSALRMAGRMTTSNGLPFVVDGIYGADTEQAVCDFQRFQGIKADGVYGAETEKRLALFIENQSVSQLKDVFYNCITAIEQLPEYKELMEVVNG